MKMAEAIVISLFLILLVIFQIKEQRRIVIPAKHNIIKVVLTLALAAASLFIFWPQTLADQIKLTAFALMIAAFGLLKEGLAQDHLVKLGVMAGAYPQYEMIQLEESPFGETFVTFYKGKNSHFSQLYPQDSQTLVAFFQERGLADKLLLGPLPEPEKRTPKKIKAAK